MTVETKRRLGMGLLTGLMLAGMIAILPLSYVTLSHPRAIAQVAGSTKLVAELPAKAPTGKLAFVGQVAGTKATVSRAPVVAKAPASAPVVLAHAALLTLPTPAAPTPVVVAAVAPPPVTVAAAAAQPAKTAAALSVSDLLNWLLKLAGLVLATVIPILLQRWLGGKVSADQLAAYSKLAVDAVGHSEELGHQAIKNGKTALDSDAKANAAAAYVLQAAKALNLRPMAESAVKQLVDAKLGTERAGSPVALEISAPNLAVPAVLKVTTMPKPSAASKPLSEVLRNGGDK